jgi:hypothetical protein
MIEDQEANEPASEGRPQGGPPRRAPREGEKGWKEDPDFPGLYWFWDGEKYPGNTFRGRFGQRPVADGGEVIDYLAPGVYFRKGKFAFGLLLIVFGLGMAAQVDWAILCSGDSALVENEVQNNSGFSWLIAIAAVLGGARMAFRSFQVVDRPSEAMQAEQVGPVAESGELEESLRDEAAAGNDAFETTESEKPED